MEALKISRSALSGTITRVFNKLQKMLHDDPNSLDVLYLRRQLESIATSDSSFHKVHAEISELRSPETNDKDEMDILDAHDDSVAKTISLIERLIAIQNIYASATDLHHQVDVVEQAIKGSPDMTFDKDIQELKDEEVRIRSYLRESTIPIDHEVRELCLKLTPKIISLSGQRVSSLHVDSSDAPHKTSSTQI